MNTFLKAVLIKARKIKEIDKASFEELFKDNFKPLVAFANKYLNDIDSSKDIVHEVFIKLWEKRSLLDLNKSPRSYLYTSVNNRSLNYLRDNKKFSQNKVSYENIDTGISNDFSEISETNDIELRINQTLDKLPKKCKTVFMMSRYEDLKYKEIAKELDISIKTVESHISKALKELRKSLSKYITILLFCYL